MFPPIECADADGLLAAGGNLDFDTLYQAYSTGIFPWPVEGLPLLWFAPPLRALLFLDDFYINRRTLRAMHKHGFESRIDTDFEGVINACSEPRPGENRTWITPAMKVAYCVLSRKPNRPLRAHSFETYCQGQLVGGLYGIQIGRYFCGESMFYRVPGASKFALMQLVQYMRELGADWLDIQMMTPHFASLGACEVPRAEFTQMLQTVLENTENVRAL